MTIIVYVCMYVPYDKYHLSFPYNTLDHYSSRTAFLFLLSQKVSSCLGIPAPTPFLYSLSNIAWFFYSVVH